MNVLCMNVCLCLFVWRDEGRVIGGHTLTSSVDSFKLDITLWGCTPNMRLAYMIIEMYA